MHLLVVEDEVSLASAIKRVLQDDGHAVDVSGDGAEALEKGLSQPYDVVILDVMLPSLNGYELAKRWRRAGKTMPIIMLTARDSVTDNVTGLDAGADDYVLKPCSTQELLARVRAQGRRLRLSASDPTSLVVGDLELDLLAHEALRGGLRIELTAKEFALLEALMRHPGQVLTKAQLLERVWGFDAYTETNIVETYIHYVRNKVDSDYEPKLIRTVRGVGYAIRAV